MLHAKFGANSSYCLGGVRKSRFSLSRFCEWKDTAQMCEAYTTQFSSTQGTCRDNVQQCATYYVGFMGQKCFCIENSTGWRIGKPFVGFPQEGTDNNCSKFRVSPMKILESKESWPKILHRASEAHGEVVT